MKKISGVYKIENKLNGKVYIGSSINIRRRFYDHKTKLKHNKHHNQYLQNAVNKYGIENFKCTILERCEEHLTLQRERYWMKYCGANNSEYGYNLAIIANTEKFVFSQEHKQKLLNSWTKKRRQQHSKAMINRDMQKSYIVFNKSNLYQSKTLTRKQLLAKIPTDTLNQLIWTTNTYNNNYIYPQDSYSGCRLLERITKDLYDPTTQANTVYVFNNNNYLILTLPSQAKAAKYFDVSDRAIRKAIVKVTRIKRKYYISNNPDFVIPTKSKRKEYGGRGQKKNSYY